MNGTPPKNYVGLGSGPSIFSIVSIIPFSVLYCAFLKPFRTFGSVFNALFAWKAF